MVLFRLLQGMAGAALVPLSQSVLLDAYSAEERGQAMAIWGVGVMLGPIMGPTLGAWLTDNYSWHWVFLINLPIGIITLLGMWMFMEETKKHEQLRFDWFGFVALAVGIGSLQLLLDRGEQVGWFDSREIWIEAIVSVAGFYYFFAHSLTTDEPFVRFEMFKDRNFISGCIFMMVIGVVLFGTMALVTPFMQNLLGYPIQTAGFLLGSRGVGTLITMLAAPRLMQMVHPRYLILCGLLLAGGTLYYMTGFSLDVTQDDDRRHQYRARHRPGPAVRADLDCRVRNFAQSPAYRRNRHHYADPQYRLLDRHINGDRQSHQQDDGDARATDANRSRRSTAPCKCPMWSGI